MTTLPLYTDGTGAPVKVVDAEGKFVAKFDMPDLAYKFVDAMNGGNLLDYDDDRWREQINYAVVKKVKKALRHIEEEEFDRMTNALRLKEFGEQLEAEIEEDSKGVMASEPVVMKDEQEMAEDLWDRGEDV
jgi:hypothetical protein